MFFSLDANVWVMTGLAALCICIASHLEQHLALLCIPVTYPCTQSDQPYMLDAMLLWFAGLHHRAIQHAYCMGTHCAQLMHWSLTAGSNIARSLTPHAQCTYPDTVQLCRGAADKAHVEKIREAAPDKLEHVDAI